MRYYDVAVLEVDNNKREERKMEVEGTFKHNGVRYYYSATAIVSIDKNYGADADGKRGEEVAFIEELDIHEIKDENDFDATGELASEYLVIDKIEQDIFSIIAEEE